MRNEECRFRIVGYVIGLLLLVGSGILLATKEMYAQDNATVTVDEYRARLETLRTELVQSTEPSSALVAAQTQLSQVLTVTMPSGLTIGVIPLLAEVEDADVALQRLDLAIDQMDRAANDRSEARLAQLQAILNRQPTNPLAQLWQRFLRWLRDFLRQFERNGAPSQGMLAMGEASGWVILIVAGLAIALVLGYWLQGILGNFIAERRLREAGNEDGLPQSAAAARQEAQQLAQAGNYRQAVRRMYLAALLGLDESGLIRYDRTLTNREVLAQTQSAAAVQDHLRPVVETFDDVWYGIHEPDERVYQGYVTEIDELEALVKAQSD